MKDIISALNLAQSLARQIDAKEVSAIERDLALEKLRNIYDLLLGVAVAPEVQEPLAESVIELIEELVDEVEEFDNEEEEPTEEPVEASAEEEVAEVEPTEEPEVKLAEEPAEDEPQEELEDSVIELIEDLVEEVEVFDNDEEVEELKAETESEPEPEPAVEPEVRPKTKLAHSAILALYDDDDEEDDVNDAPAEVDEVDVAEEDAVEEQENEVVIDMTELVPPVTEPENEEGESAEPEAVTAVETVEPATSEPEENEPKVAAAEPAKVVLGEVLGADQPTLADRIAADAPADVASLANAQKSLVEMIGLNDKFILLRDLFHNNHDYYEAAIDQLDEFESIDEAMLFIHDNFQWNPNSEGAKLMVELLTNKLL